ncbi:MAG: hypothetical protein M1822_007148 [Bathelium mastoideum]|nr:MAG: hypothetical protein M1822_007148 [Bathelium mastoideum]
MACLSTVVVPVLLETNSTPSPLLRQWVRLYHYGHIYMPAACVATCGLYGYAALCKRTANRKQWLIYAASGAMTSAMVPFTWAAMAPTNNVLFRLEVSATSSTSAADLRAVQELLVKWAGLHIVRSVFPLLGAILGLAGILQELGL